MWTRRNKRKPKRVKPRLPSFRINWRAMLIPPAALAGVALAVFVAMSLLDQPVGRLVIEGPLQRVSALEIEAALDGELAGGFLSLDLDRLKARIAALEWTDRVKIGRVWPDTLVISISEHRAAARWGSAGLLNVRGELFTENVRHEFPELPRLVGPSGSEQQVAEVYLAVRGRLAAANLALESLTMDPRGALSIELATGQQIRLGRRDLEARLGHFFEVVAPALATDFHRVEYVDLRYTNGFAVGWVESEELELLSSREPAARG